MKKYALIVFLVLIFLTVLVFFVITILNNRKSITLKNGTLFGISGYSPVNFPNSSLDELGIYWEEINQYADLYGVHAPLEDTSLLELASQQLEIPISLVISHRDLFDLDKIYEILDKNPKIGFLGIGNEINHLKEISPEEYNEFYAEAQVKFPEIKNRYPELQLFTIFQYETLIGKGFLTGKTRLDTTQLILDWENLVDLVGLTVYPYFDYRSVNEVPENYFDPIASLTQKAIGITEISWPSKISIFTEANEKFNTNEKEQSDFIGWVELIKNKYSFKFINWIFLNDIDLGNPLFNGIGLKNQLGNPKPALEKWNQL